MPWFSKGKSRNQQAIDAVHQRGVVATNFLYTSFPWNTHPDDQKLRLVPTGPFTQAWQGIQKVNEISKVGMRRASMYGAEPIFLRQVAVNVNQLVRGNAAANAVGAGPALQASMTETYQATGVAPSLKSMIMQKMLGRT